MHSFVHLYRHTLCYLSGRVTQLKRPDDSETTNQSPIDTIKIPLHKYDIAV